MDEPDLPVPDGIEPISAYRAWIYWFAHGRGDLNPISPIADRSTWNDWEGAGSGWVSARCSLTGDHDVPSESCSCGFYSLKDLDAAIELASLMQLVTQEEGPDAGQVVFGRVLLAGKVIEHERGYRAARARIAELIPLRGTERAVMVLANQLGVGMAAAVEPRSEGLPGALRARPRLCGPAATASNDPRADTLVGVIAAFFLLTACALAIAGVWVPPLGFVIVAFLTIGRTADPMAEAFRGWRSNHRRVRLRVVPPLPPRP